MMIIILTITLILALGMLVFLTEKIEFIEGIFSPSYKIQKLIRKYQYIKLIFALMASASLVWLVYDVINKGLNQ